jgi:hypothetical protein
MLLEKEVDTLKILLENVKLVDLEGLQEVAIGTRLGPRFLQLGFGQYVR